MSLEIRTCLYKKHQTKNDMSCNMPGNPKVCMDEQKILYFSLNALVSKSNYLAHITLHNSSIVFRHCFNIKDVICGFIVDLVYGLHEK